MFYDIGSKSNNFRGYKMKSNVTSREAQLDLLVGPGGNQELAARQAANQPLLRPATIHTRSFRKYSRPAAQHTPSQPSSQHNEISEITLDCKSPMASSRSEGETQPQESSQKDLNPFIVFRRYADTKFSEILQTVVGLPSDTTSNRTRSQALEESRQRQLRELGSWGGLLATTERDPADPFHELHSKLSQTAHGEDRSSWSQDTGRDSFNDWVSEMLGDRDYSPVNLEDRWPDLPFGAAFTDLCRTSGSLNPAHEELWRWMGCPYYSFDRRQHLGADKDMEGTSKWLRRAKEQIQDDDKEEPPSANFKSDSEVEGETELNQYESYSAVSNSLERLILKAILSPEDHSQESPEPPREPGQCNVLATLTTTEQVTDADGKNAHQSGFKEAIFRWDRGKHETIHKSQSPLQKAIRFNDRVEKMDNSEDTNSKMGKTGRGWFWSD